MPGIPGKTHCLTCGAGLVHRKVFACDKCTAVVYCSARCRMRDLGLHGDACEALKAAIIGSHSLVSLEEDEATVGQVWARMCTESGEIKAWKELWDENELLDAEEVVKLWRATEQLSAPLAFYVALTNGGAALPIKDVAQIRIDFVGIEWEFSHMLRPIWRRVFRLCFGKALVIAHCVGPLLASEFSDEVDGIRISGKQELYRGTGDAHLVVALNPGLSVPDYDWKDAVNSIRGTLISTCHSEEEAAVERESELLSPEFECPYQQPNPWASLLWLQSGTLSCEVYRKNACISIYRRKAR